DERPGQAEMLAPVVAPGMIEQDDVAGLRIDRRQVGPLMPVAPEATQCQVGFIRGSTVLLSDHVIDLVWHEHQGFWSEAVFTTLASTLPDDPPQRGRDVL